MVLEEKLFFDAKLLSFRFPLCFIGFYKNVGRIAFGLVLLQAFCDRVVPEKKNLLCSGCAVYSISNVQSLCLLGYAYVGIFLKKPFYVSIGRWECVCFTADDCSGSFSGFSLGAYQVVLLRNFFVPFPVHIIVSSDFGDP